MSNEVSNLNSQPKRRSGSKRAVRWFVSLAVLLLVADQAARIWEYQQILTVAESSEVFINDYKADLLVFQDDLAFGFDAEAIDRESAIRARDAEADMLAEGAKLDVIPLLPWHTSLKQALLDYKAHNEAWVAAAKFSSIDGDGLVTREMDIALINSTWEDALASLRVSLPLFDVANFANRLIVVEKA